MRFGTRERFITDHRLADMVLPLPVSAGSTDMAMISARAASGTCTQNMARQPASGIRSPPSDGPSAVPSAETVPSRPIGLGEDFADASIFERRRQVICGEFI